jgi:hypothetical protein
MGSVFLAGLSHSALGIQSAKHLGPKEYSVGGMARRLSKKITVQPSLLQLAGASSVRSP